MKIIVCLGLFLFCVATGVDAQLCNGNLGDPIMNITFGAAGKPLPPSATTFEYMGGCPSKGKYTISDFLFGCGNRTWVKMVGDHTGDAHGDYMLVNAESTPGTIYVDTVTGLCSNTTYQFSAWITSVMQTFTCNGTALLPNITFTAETTTGQVIASYSTGGLPLTDDKQWKQYGLSFKTAAAVDAVVLRLTINPAFGCGSAFALDDIKLQVCGPPVSVTVNGSDNSSIEVCADYRDQYTLQASYGAGLTDPVVQWQSSVDSGTTYTNIPGEKSTTFHMPKRSDGVILYRILVAERQNINSPKCRITSNSVYTNIHPLIAHQPPGNILGCIGKNLVLPYPAELAQSVEWSGPNNYFSNKALSVVPDISYADTGIYKLKQVFDYGCTDLDTFNLQAFPGATVSTQAVYNLCEGANVTLTASGEGSFKWTPSDNLSSDAVASPVLTPHDSTLYKVTLTNTYGCKDSALVVVNIFKRPFANAGSNITIIKGDSVKLSGMVKGTAVNYYWTPDNFIQNSLSITPKVFPPEDIEYTLNAVSTVGCGTASSTVKIRVFDNIYVPSAFTPNNDGLNDKLNIVRPSGYELIQLLIYNRWGQLVYSGNHTMDGWDGKVNNKPQDPGTYVYFLEMQSPSGKKISKKGSIILIR